MAVFRCPGQDSRFWKPSDVKESLCPHCGRAMEFWKDEPRQRCRGCGKVVQNPDLDLGCAKWCKYAAQCIGAAALPDADAALCDRLIAEVRKLFADEPRRIEHSLVLLDYAEKILDAEGGDPLVVKAAAALHDVADTGARSVRSILQAANVDQDHVSRVAGILSDTENGIEADIVRDAAWLADVAVYATTADERECLREAANGVLRTRAARRLADQRACFEHAQVQSSKHLGKGE